MKDFMKYNHYEGDIQQFNIDMNKDAKIADLEAKLAESEKEKDYYQDLYFTSVKGQDQLKQQLAEKDDVIKRLKAIERYNIGELFKTYVCAVVTKRQFAIEQLLKARGQIDDYCNVEDCKTIIDRIINELRGGDSDNFE